jgi:hypothetical protein
VGWAPAVGAAEAPNRRRQEPCQLGGEGAFGPRVGGLPDKNGLEPPVLKEPVDMPVTGCRLAGGQAAVSGNPFEAPGSPGGAHVSIPAVKPYGAQGPNPDLPPDFKEEDINAASRFHNNSTNG